MLATSRRPSLALDDVSADPGVGGGRGSLSAQAKSLYKSIMRQGAVACDELPALCGLSLVVIQPTVEELANLGLVRVERGELVAVPYLRAVDTLLDEHLQVIGDAVTRVRQVQWRLGTLIRAGAWLGGDSPGTLLATSVGTEDPAGRTYVSRVRPRVSLDAMHPGARFSQELLDSSLRRAEADLAGGVRLRAVHQSAALSHSLSTEYLHRIERLGAQVRLRDHLPFRLIVIDGESAACCLQWQDGLEETLLLQGARMLGLLDRLFETIWIDSTPLGLAEDDRPAAIDVDQGYLIPPLTGQQQAIVRCLADGATDQAIAHALGVTTRTVTRRINEIYQVLGVRSRFQAGAMARRMGLI